MSSRLSWGREVDQLSRCEHGRRRKILWLNDALLFLRLSSSPCVLL